jgi:hypothetical protein
MLQIAAKLKELTKEEKKIENYYYNIKLPN